MLDTLWNLFVIRLSDIAGDATHGVGVAAKGDGVFNGIFVRGRIEECDYGLGHRSLTGDVERIHLNVKFIFLGQQALQFSDGVQWQ